MIVQQMQAPQLLEQRPVILVMPYSLRVKWSAKGRRQGRLEEVGRNDQ